MLILHNANIYTIDGTKPRPTAVAIQDGQILATGSDEDIFSIPGRNPTKIDLDGRTLWPGLTDAHLHLERYALGIDQVACETDTLDECLERVRARASEIQPGKWILGHGWNQNTWADGFGTIEQLNDAAPDNPVYLTAKSLHAAWVNQPAMNSAKIDENTPNPTNGQIGRDFQGKPNGILYEGAMEMVSRIIPLPSLQDTADAIEKAQVHLWKSGLTCIHDFDSTTCFSALRHLHNTNRLQLRVQKSIPIESLDDAIRQELRTGIGDTTLWIGPVKIFADGALGPQSAALFEPYQGQGQNLGMLFFNSEEIYEVGQKTSTAGFSLAIHAIGDRANHEALKGLGKLRTFENNNHLIGLRHRIEHVQILHPNDLPLLRRHKIIGSVQPIHATSDMSLADHYLGERTRYCYAYKSLLDGGVILAFGSDAPVESPNPFWGLHSATTRCRKDGYPDDCGWHPEQRIPLEIALKGYTTGASYAASRETTQGRIEPGYNADLILLPVDPFTIPKHEIHHITPLATMVGGRWVWKSHNCPVD